PARASMSTLVPYTTLFRSDGMLRALSTADGKVIWEYNTVREYESVNGVPAKGGAMGQAGATVVGGMLFVGSGYGTGNSINGNALDRKSTRLNSSHQIISYA